MDVFKVAFQEVMDRKKWGVFRSKPSGYGGAGFKLVDEFDNKKDAVNFARRKARNNPGKTMLEIETVSGRLSQKTRYD